MNVKRTPLPLCNQNHQCNRNGCDRLPVWCPDHGHEKDDEEHRAAARELKKTKAREARLRRGLERIVAKIEENAEEMKHDLRKLLEKTRS